MQKKLGLVHQYAAQTDVGSRRDHNEDCYLVNEDLALFVVADGMGGHACGEVASEIAITTIELHVAQGAGLVEAIEYAHLAIIDSARESVRQRGMGTTVVAAQLQENEYTLAWVGDSRAYLWDGGLQRLSKDHSLVQMLIDSGQISEAEARVHPRKNVIYQNLGAETLKDFQVSMKTGSLCQGQKLILCSDGLSDEVDDEIISGIMRQGFSDDEAIAKLIAAAIQNGGHDNITVVIVLATDSAPEKVEKVLSAADIDKDTLVPES